MTYTLQSPRSVPYRQVRADYDDKTIVVYQAYRPEIALAAVAAQKFVEPFSMTRMTWVKPSFLWMMERCGWATKLGQEHVLKVRLTRAGWEEALSHASLTEHAIKGAVVQVQWDPERSVRGGELDYRSIQVGIGRQIVECYVDLWVVSIEDITPFVARLREKRKAGDFEQLTAQLPNERPYPLPVALKVQLNVDG
jgi:hypothetical protein